MAVNRDAARTRIVEVAARLLREQGVSAVTTRGVAEAAGVQAPTIYRLFGDKDGLLDAVAEQVMAEFVAGKAVTVAQASAAGVDPLDDLRAGWRHQIDFGLANPDVFRLLSDPDRVRMSPATGSGRDILRQRVHRLAAAGRLRVGEQRAVELIQAAGTGTIQTLLAVAPDQRDPELADSMLDAVLRQILVDAPAAPDGGVRAAAVALRAAVPELAIFSDAERRLLAEWLDRTIAEA